MKKKLVLWLMICLLLSGSILVPAYASELNNESGTGSQELEGDTLLDPDCEHEFGAWTSAEEGHTRECEICHGIESAGHSYGAWQDYGTSHHQTCADCGNIQRAAHVGTWTPNGSTHRMQCSLCGATPSAYHEYGAWSNTGNGHSRTCSTCGGVENGEHTWSDADAEGKRSCSVCGAEQTQTHTHSFGRWTASGDSHSRSCSGCTEVETGDHSWSAADANGNKTCTVCAAVDTHVHTYGSWSASGSNHSRTCSGCANVESGAHTYGSWSKAGAKHERSCSVCSGKESADHTWDQGTVAKEATCKEEGRKEYLCTLCGAAGVEVLSKTSSHTYSSDCDESCNVCDAKRNVSHKYNNEWSKDSSGHWHVCSVCSAITDNDKHTPGAAATETRDQVCTVCSFVIQPRKTHVHNYAVKLTNNDKGHWYACSGCETKKEYKEHSFANTCDDKCDDCGYTRKVQHTYNKEWSSDANGHWNQCTVCKAKSEINPHNPGPAATEVSGQLCSICSYELVPKLEKDTQSAITDETWHADDASHWRLGTSGEKLQEALHTWDLGKPNPDGSVTYSCTVCQTQRVQQPLETLEEEESGGFNWAILLLVVLIVLFIGTAVALVVVVYMTKKKEDIYEEDQDEIV